MQMSAVCQERTLPMPDYLNYQVAEKSDYPATSDAQFMKGITGFHFSVPYQPRSVSLKV